LSRLGPRTDDYIERSTKLIDALPIVDSINDLEIRVVLQEVFVGLLEWAYHESDGKYKMSEYAQLALEGEGLNFRLTEAEVKKLNSSWIQPYISPAASLTENDE
jgi:hypothetical protein